jgi:hypothetical protein
LSKAIDVNRKFGFSGQMNVFALLQGSSVLPAPERQLSPDIVQIDRDLDTNFSHSAHPHLNANVLINLDSKLRFCRFLKNIIFQIQKAGFCHP